MATTTAPKKDSAKPSSQLSKEKLLELFQKMMLIRRFEERTMQNYQQAKIGGFCHIYIGQEATAVGSVGACNPDDPIITAYRDHGHALARDMHPNYAMAEMFGKITGCAKGKGGSMHFFDKPHHMYGGHAIVGGQCPLGVGLAWGIQYNKEDKVCLCYLGDGALNQGAFHEAMNLASVYNLPIIFVLENNNYSMGTQISRGTSMAEDLASKAESYGIRYAECDGQDVLDTYNTFYEQVQKTRGARPINYNEETNTRDDLPTYSREGRTPGPAFINVKTYRYQGHSMSDPQKYRTKNEVEQYKTEEVDCINRLAIHLIDNNMATQAELDAIDQECKKLSTDSVKFAEESAPTPMSELFTDIYSEPYGEPFRKGDIPDIMKDPEGKRFS